MAAHEKPVDQKRIVARLAREAHVSIGEVAVLYEHERAQLADGAHIAKFLHIFATRNVKEILRLRGLDQALLAGGAALLAA